MIALSIRRPVFAWMLMSALIVFGAVSFLRMGVSQLPDVDFPVLDVQITYEGAAPEVVEADLVENIESRVIAVQGVREIRSSVRNGSANVRLEFDLGRDIDSALQEVQAALTQLRLPAGADPLIIKKTNPEEEPILYVALSGTKSLLELTKYVQNTLIDQYQVISGVGEVSIGGFSIHNLRVWLELSKLRQHGVSAVDVLRAIDEGHNERAGGYIENSQTEKNVRVLGESLTAEQFKQIPIRTRGSEPIQDRLLRLSDVARVEDGVSDIRRVARVNGQEALVFFVKKSRGANEVDVAHAVRKRIEETKAALPPGMSMQVVSDWAKYAEQTVHATKSKLFLSAVVTSLVCLLFLASFSAAFNVLLSIPTSLLGTIIVLYFSGFTLNLFTLLGLALAVSIVVDDAIMVLENIVRHQAMGKSSAQAAYDGTQEVWLAASATTLAVVAIFLPVLFMSGPIGRFFFQFGVTVSTAVSLSLVEAVTLIPMRASQMGGAAHSPGRWALAVDHVTEWCKRVYGRALHHSLEWKWVTALVTVGLFAVSLVGLNFVRKEFVPTQDQSLVVITLQAPTGWSLARTNERVKEVEEFIRIQPDVLRFFVSVGAGGPSADINAAFIPVTLKPKNERTTSHEDFANRIRKQFAKWKDVRVMIRDLSSRGLTAGRVYPVSFTLRGPDRNRLKEIAGQIIAELDRRGLAVDLDVDQKDGKPEVLVIPKDPVLASRAVTADGISRTVNAAVAGIREGQFTTDGRRYDIRVRLDPGDRDEVSELSKLQVRNQFNQLIDLGEVADFKEHLTVQTINRLNRARSLSVTGNLSPGKSQAVVLEETKKIASAILPPEYTFQLDGAAQSFNESFSGLGFALLIGVIIAYMILASQFNSFLDPFSILLALPFGLSGAFVSLWASGLSLNIYSYIGLILLMGIAKKNSIMLIEFANRAYRHAPNWIDALVEAGRERLRPILMTSLVTVAAAIPLAFDSSDGCETRIPMGTAILGGTIVSTLFTLFAVPAIHLIFRGWFPLKLQRQALFTITHQNENNAA